METDLHSLLRIRTEGGVTLEGELVIPTNASGLVLFSHGSGSSRHSPRNNFVAQQLQHLGLATFLFDLLTAEEAQIYSQRFNIDLLADRLEHVTLSLQKLPQVKGLPIGYFGASTGAAAALGAASVLQNRIHAIVSRGGRPDLSMDRLYLIKAPTLLIVGEYDEEVLSLNRKAYDKLATVKSLKTIKRATHLFEEKGALEEVAKLSGEWFTTYLTTAEPAHDSRAVISNR
jgi:pimeloyl-ACP methyl ester carboxylesterase